jgi:hypothetical protein
VVADAVAGKFDRGVRAAAAPGFDRRAARRKCDHVRRVGAIRAWANAPATKPDRKEKHESEVKIASNVARR